MDDFRFRTEQQCHDYLELVRWSDLRCPACDTEKPYALQYQHTYNKRYKCQGCGLFFSLHTGTIFNETKEPLLKWFRAIHLITSYRDVSVSKLAREIKTTKATASRWKKIINYIIVRTQGEATLLTVILFPWDEEQDISFKPDPLHEEVEQQVEEILKPRYHRERVPDAVLPIGDVRNIRVALLYGGVSRDELLKRYQIDSETLTDIEQYRIYPAIKVT